MNYIRTRIKQLEVQIGDPEVLDQSRVEIKLEALKDCLKGIIQTGELYHISVSLPVDSFDADEFLNTKDIWNHPYISDRTNDNGYEVAQLMADFANSIIQQ